MTTANKMMAYKLWSTHTVCKVIYKNTNILNKPNASHFKQLMPT